MIALLFILLLGALILLFGVRLLLQAWSRRDKLGVTVDDFSQAREALDVLFVEAAAVERIFSIEDAEFVAHTASRDTRNLFFRDRKRLALQWLQRIQKEVAELMDLHLRLAGYTYDTSPRFEFKLASRYLIFLMVSNFVVLLLSLFGPFNARRLITYTIRAAENLCTAFSLRLDRINPSLLHSRPEYMAG